MRDRFEHPVQSGQFEHGFDLGLQAGELQAPLVGNGVLEAGNEGAETGTVDEPDILEVDEDVFLSLFEEREEFGLQIIGVVGVETLFLDGDDHQFLLFRDVEIHGFLLWNGICMQGFRSLRFSARRG